MAKSRKSSSSATAGGVEDYRYTSSKRKNNPPAAMASAAPVPVIPKAQYAYNPHLPPVLRFDATGKSDVLETRLSEAAVARAAVLIGATATRPLTEAEREELASLLRQAATARVAAEPWLEWTGKRERRSFEVDPVALHIHERISAQAILKVAARQDAQRDLFADPQQAYHEAVQFYKHDIAWTNRLILGDSLSVMSSLAKREDLAGKVQMIYMDPPYGIKFGSNFQPEIGRRDVKDKSEDLTRELEMVRAYRDTWSLGVHSYLAYLRDRLIAAKELLADSGSVFVQIGDENLHLVRDLLDEIFGRDQFVSIITVQKSGGLGTSGLRNVADFVLCYSRDATKVKYRQLYRLKNAGEGHGSGGRYDSVEEPSGNSRRATDADIAVLGGVSFFRLISLTSIGANASTSFRYDFQGVVLSPQSNRCWSTNKLGMDRASNAERIVSTGTTLNLKYYIDDYPAYELTNVWSDIASPPDKVYAVQTHTKLVERCLLMTTDPGDLVLDPTCGSGTTAYVAEQWGRRWITTDTSRVAVSIARQRLLTAKFDYYKTKPTPGASPTDPNGNPAKGFLYKTVPHVTLKSIAQNVALDPIFAKHEPVLVAKLAAANAALAAVPADLRHTLEAKLLVKQKGEGKKAITDADRRRWLLPPRNRDRSAESVKRATVDLEATQWYAWEVPFDTDPDWPAALQEAVTDYRRAWRAKMDEVNGCIAASAEQEELVDQPEVVRGVTRVSGPFTVEAVQPPEMSLGDMMGEIGSEFAGAPDEVGPTFAVTAVVGGVGHTPQDLAAYLDKMVRLLKLDGVRFPNNKQKTFSRLESIYDSRQGQGMFHAEGRWTNAGEADPDPDGPATVGIVVGPQYGPVTASVVDNLIKPASRRYDDLVIAAFSFDAAAVAILSEDPHLKLRLHIAHIRPDVNPAMEGLLKDSPGGELFTVFGLPRITLSAPDVDGMYQVTMEGVDIYDPVTNKVTPTGADKVAAWFLDSDYDGRTFCVTQAFFPDRTAWDKLAKALGGTVDPERFEALSGTTSLPFAAGTQKRVAVKVIDPRGNEVMTVQTMGA